MFRTSSNTRNRKFLVAVSSKNKPTMALQFPWGLILSKSSLLIISNIARVVSFAGLLHQLELFPALFGLSL